MDEVPEVLEPGPNIQESHIALSIEAPAPDPAQTSQLIGALLTSSPTSPGNQSTKRGPPTRSFTTPVRLDFDTERTAQ